MRSSAFRRQRAGAGLLGVLAVAALLSGCDESLLPGPDRERPRVKIVVPTVGAVIDARAPLTVEATASDDQGVKSIELSVIGTSGQALYKSETVEFGVDRPAPRSAEVLRTLTPIAGAPASAEARVISLVTDFAERRSADTVRVTLQANSGEEDGGVVGELTPQVRFSVSAPVRVELTDTVTVAVSATGKTALREVGVTLFAILRGGAKPDTLSTQTQRIAGSAATVQFALDQLNFARLEALLSTRDSASLSLEITAFAVDAAGACAAATARDSIQSLPCRAGPGNATLGPSAGARSDVLVTRGRTVRLSSAGDRLADLAWDGRRLFASNLTSHVLEVLNAGDTRFNAGSRINVGSEPWGLALGRDNATLFVANSGGTNISAVSLSTLRETGRIQTPKALLFDITFKMDSVAVGPPPDESTPAPKELHQVPSAVTLYDYSDRPQFLAQTASGELVFSTKPTSTARDGTVRRLIPPAGNDGFVNTELFVEYARSHLDDRVAILNALEARLTPTDPKQLIVLPRSCVGSNAVVQGYVDQVETILRSRGCDTKFIYGLDVAAVGLADTTFVAVSGNRRFVAVGEGARTVGRVMLFEDQGAGAISATSANIRNLTLNAASSVTGLALNADGSLGAARGTQAFYFNEDLRLQGVASVGQPSGGVAMHPQQSGLSGLSFVSGVDAVSGVPFVDVVEVRNFARRRRIIVKEAVTGSLIAVMATGADAAAGASVTLYGITRSGVVKLNLSASDLPAS